MIENRTEPAPPADVAEPAPPAQPADVAERESVKDPPVSAQRVAEPG
jgi:hypothetical protein